MMNTAHLHWILDAAAINPIPLNWILPNVSGHMNARSIPGLQVNDYAALVGSAVDKSLIELSSDGQPLDLANARATVTEHAGGLQASKERRVYLQLTEQGGQAWERLAAPQWDRFFYYSFLLPDQELRVSATLASRNFETVMAYLGWFERLDSVDVKWETLKIETRSNYAATYWKRLDGVHEAILDGIYHLPERYAPRFVSDWVLSLNDWRQRPWDRADWPREPA